MIEKSLPTPEKMREEAKIKGSIHKMALSWMEQGVVRTQDQMDDDTHQTIAGVDKFLTPQSEQARKAKDDFERLLYRKLLGMQFREGHLVWNSKTLSDLIYGRIEEGYLNNRRENIGILQGVITANDMVADWIYNEGNQKRTPMEHGLMVVSQLIGIASAWQTSSGDNFKWGCGVNQKGDLVEGETPVEYLMELDREKNLVADRDGGIVHLKKYRDELFGEKYFEQERFRKRFLEGVAIMFLELANEQIELEAREREAVESRKNSPHYQEYLKRRGGV